MSKTTVIENATNNVSLPQVADIDRSKIQWCGPTWNPWQGCIKVSEGCKFCYMYADKKRYGKDPSIVVRSAAATFDKPLKWQREVDRGVRSGQDTLVFTCSWSDWFIEEADGWRGKAWEIIRRCPGLTFQILTKRIERATECLPPFWDEIKGRCWIGCSVENQERAAERIPHLLRVPAAVRFLSVEPLLGAVDLTRIPQGSVEYGDGSVKPAIFNPLMVNPVVSGARWGVAGIHWVIVGGESGHGARRFDLSWGESIISQCGAAEVPVFFKQAGSNCGWMDADDDWHGLKLKDSKGGDLSELPGQFNVREFPAAKALA